MHLTHPIAPYQGIAPEDCFFVTNDQMIEMGMGSVTLFYQPEMYPEAPLHIYMQLDSQPAGRNLLFGALLARAEVIRAQNPNIPARLYTQLPVEAEELLSFYQRSGLVLDDAEDMFGFSPNLPADGRTPMGLQYASVPLEGDAQQDAFLRRLNAMRIAPIQRDQLTLWREQSNFLALGFYRGGQPVTELMTVGNGEQAILVAVYTRSENRRQGLATALMGLAGNVLKERGVEQVFANIFRRNAPQVALMKKLNAQFIRTATLLPGMDI